MWWDELSSGSASKLHPWALAFHDGPLGRPLSKLRSTLDCGLGVEQLDPCPSQASPDAFFLARRTETCPPPTSTRRGRGVVVRPQDACSCVNCRELA